MNAILLMEGEEENSSEGFRETVLQNLHWFRGTSLILQANSTWVRPTHPSTPLIYIFLSPLTHPPSSLDCG